MDATAEGTGAASFTSGTITIGTGAGRVTATASAIVMATQSASDATPRISCIRQVATVFRALSVRGRHNKSRRLQGDAVNVITRLYEIVHLLVWVSFRVILETFNLTTAAIITISVITSKLSCYR